MFKSNNIFSKLFLSYALIILLSFLMFGLVFLYLFHINLYDEFEETFFHHYVQVEEHFQSSVQFDWSREETTASLKPSLTHKNISVFIYNANGEILYAPDGTESMVRTIDHELIQKASSGEMISKGGREHGSLRYVIASPLNIQEGENNIGIMTMVFHDLDHQYRQMILMILLTFSITIAFAGVVLWFISRKITAPLRDMNNIALKLAKGNFSLAVNVESNDEIGQLGETFNYMAEELNSLEESRKEFIANVSHDLRSPLTSIKGFLIALLDGTIPEKRRDHYYLLMKDETERVIKLVNDTLDMTQLEAGQVKLKRENYDLLKQLQMLIAKLEPHLVTKEIEIKIIPDNEEFFVFADRDRIEQALINLLQNAMQFSTKRSDIKIFLEKQSQHVQIRIQDDGEGISGEQLENIWKRFYKTDKARTNKAGIGIGLSIVKSIMDLHNATINVESSPGEGTTFYFLLPLSK